MVRATLACPSAHSAGGGGRLSGSPDAARCLGPGQSGCPRPCLPLPGCRLKHALYRPLPPTVRPLRSPHSADVSVYPVWERTARLGRPRAARRSVLSSRAGLGMGLLTDRRPQGSLCSAWRLGLQPPSRTFGAL